MFADWPLLSLLIWLPIFGGAIVLVSGDKDRQASQRLAFVFATLTVLLSIPLYLNFDITTAAVQFEEKLSWIPSLNIHYHLGIDGIALPLIILTTITSLLVVLGASSIKERLSQYLAAFLFLEGMMIGVFSSLDGILFYIFFEAMLIPMFLIIGIWGGPNRVYATIKFFLYTFLGSVFMLIALLYLYFQSGSFEILDWHAFPIGHGVQILIFLAFFLAFAVKIPMWPVHTWLPDAHVEAPTGGSVILAAIMLKIGGYGFLRFSLPITPFASFELQWIMITLSLIAVVYIGLVALAQQDMKKLIAYSSISHMGFVTLGTFIIFLIMANPANTQHTGSVLALSGAMVQMVSHGLVSAALFFSVGVLYDRVHSRQIQDYGGVAHSMPIFASLMVLFAMANAGLPGTSGFVGEFMVIIASFKASFWIAFLAAMTLILGAAYTLWLVKRVIFGSITHKHVEELQDVKPHEFVILGALALMILAVGIWPHPLVEVMQTSIEHLWVHVVDKLKL